MSTTTLTENHLEAAPVDVSLLSEQDKKDLVAADAISIASSTTLRPSDASFTPVKSLFIDTKGIPVLRLPVPPSELQISIYNNDGTLAYQSTRSQRSSGNCVLTDSQSTQSIATEYFFGPGKSPVLHVLDTAGGKQVDVRTASKWTSRTQTFTLPDGRAFAWEYKKERGFGAQGKKGTALVMSMNGRRTAALIRNEETRTPGSKSCSAGNGGELVLGEDVGREDCVSEELVVASCLLMLKKEIDRRRMVQVLLISGAVSA